MTDADRTYTPDEVVAKFPGMTVNWLKLAVRHDRVPHLRINRTLVLFTGEHIDAIKRQFEVKARK
jgi:hypothetical protein